MSRRPTVRHAAAAGVAAVMLAAGCSGAGGVLPGAVPAAPALPSPATTEPVESVAALAPATTIPVTTTTTAPVAGTAAASTLPDVTAVAIDLSRVESLLPPSVPGSTGHPEFRERGNGALIAGSSPDRSDEADDVVIFGRITGAAAAYPIADGFAHVWIDLLADTDSAHGYLLDAAGDVAKGVGPLRLGVAPADSVVEFPLDGLGDETIGLILDRGDSTETAVLMRVGRLVVMTSIIAPGDDRRVAVLYLAEEVADGIVSSLVAGTVAAPVDEPGDPVPAAAFSLEIEAVAEETPVFRLAARGRQIGDNLACTVEVEAGDLRVGRELRRVEGMRWTRPLAGDWSATGSVNAIDAALLAWCPGWPLDLDAAGLGGLVDREPARLVTEDFGKLLGYPGDIGQLEGALGVPLGGAELASLNAWITETDGTLIEVNLDISGPAETLGALSGPWPIPAGWIDLTLRHRIDALGDDVEPIAAPR